MIKYKEKNKVNGASGCEWMGATGRKYTIGETPAGIWVRTMECELGCGYGDQEKQLKDSSEDCMKIA